RQKFSDQESAITNCKEEILVLKYGQEYGMRVSMGRVWKGMSENMMRDSWGEPDKIDKNKEKWGVFSQWYYGEIVYFFKDGKLTEWEQGFDEAALEKERQRRIKRK
ncbi:MAG: hypothetical protein K9I99_17935, partial [Melioribacteraceae bacterium]|nr:hypothetical protein [Melioribacteraceae bacterium]